MEKGQEQGQEKGREKTTRSVLRLQDSYLNQVRRDNTPVVVQLTSGSRLEGRVSGFDSFTVIIEDSGKKYLVYKHAIATVSAAQSKGAKRSAGAAGQDGKRPAGAEGQDGKRPAGAEGQGGKPFNSSLAQLGEKLDAGGGDSAGDEARGKSGEKREEPSGD